jgi:hypothetical protein
MTRPGRPATSASSVTPRVSFSLGADEYDALQARAASDGLTPGRLAKRLTLSALDVEAARQAFAPDYGPCVECKAHGVVRQATGFERGIPVCGEHS